MRWKQSNTNIFFALEFDSRGALGGISEFNSSESLNSGNLVYMKK